MTLTSVTVTSSLALAGHGGFMMIEDFGGLTTITSSTFTTVSALNNDGIAAY
jgi:hypothetical protein